MKSPRSSIFLLSLPPLLTCRAFLAPSSVSPKRRTSPPATATTLAAKKSKKKRRTSSGEGFGKPPTAPSTADKAVRNDEQVGVAESPRALRSIDAPSAVITQQGQQPQQQQSAVVQQDLDLDPNLSPEERSKAILRSKFGLKSYEEQQALLGDDRALRDSEAKKKQRDRLRNIEQLWPEDKPELLSVLPPALLRGIDSFLKIGLGICTVAFLAAGVLITVEAGYKATGGTLPGGLEAFVLDVVQPGFTPGLGVLLAFSVSLGVFSVALGGSAASSYREDP